VRAPLVAPERARARWPLDVLVGVAASPVPAFFVAWELTTHPRCVAWFGEGGGFFAFWLIYTTAALAFVLCVLLCARQRIFSPPRSA
jgi:hypothetical protein